MELYKVCRIDEDDYGTLRIYDGEAATIAEDVHEMALTANNTVLYLGEYSGKHQTGTLYLYSGSEPTKLDDDVTAVVATYDRWTDAAYQTGGSIKHEDEAGSAPSSSSSDYDWFWDYYFGLY